MSRIIYDHTDIITEIISLRQLVQSIQQGQAAILQRLESIAQQETNMASNVQVLNEKIDALTEDVASMSAVVDKAVTFANGISAQYAAALAELKELIDANGTPEQFKAAVDRMDAANTKMDADRARLDAVLEDNKPAEPTPPTPPTA